MLEITGDQRVIGGLRGLLIFSGILDQRLRRVVRFSSRQKGFTSEDGCKTNITLLKEALSCMRAGSGGVVVVADIAKAFDAIPHSALEQCLRGKGAPGYLAEYIKKMYENCKTIVRTRNGEKVEIQLKRGVKQGDPLSPLLFNLILDPIIDRVNKETSGVHVSEDNLVVLAFADDMVVLLGKDAITAKKQVALLDEYLRKLGMELSINKCSTFEIVSSRKTWYIKNPQIQIRGEYMPEASPESTIGYLGAKIKPWIGIQKGIDSESIVNAANNVSKLKLKSHQKIELIRTYLLPRFIHGLMSSLPSLGLLKQIDQGVRQIIKRILRLHPSTTDGVLYTDRNHGGMGIQRVETIVKLAVVRSGIKLRESEDPITRNMAGDFDKRYEKYAASLGIT